MYSSEDENLQSDLRDLIDHQATIDDINHGMIDYEQRRGEPLAQVIADLKRQLGFSL